MHIACAHFAQLWVRFQLFLLDKGHEAENLQKECLFLLHYYFPMEDSSESLLTHYLELLNKGFGKQIVIL